MAESTKGKSLGKKVGPVKLWVYPAAGVGAFLIYRFLKSRSSSGTTTSTALTGGSTIPTSGSGSSDTLPTFSSFAQWEQAAISAMAGGQLSPADALNGITDWINGQCVSANQYAGIGSIIETVGLPPGFSTVPALSVCASSGGTSGGTTGGNTGGGAVNQPAAGGPPPNLAQSLVAAMTANGEHLVGSPVFDTATNTWLYLTQKGGVYALNPNGTPSSAFYGSGLSSSLGGAFGGRTAQSITANPDGSYTITDTAGENYTFGAPGQGRDYAGTTVA